MTLPPLSLERCATNSPSNSIGTGRRRWPASGSRNLIALRASLVRDLDFHRLSDRYFFEISLLCEAYFARAVLEDIPMLPVYGDETSSLRPWRMIADPIAASNSERAEM